MLLTPLPTRLTLASLLLTACAATVAAAAAPAVAAAGGSPYETAAPGAAPVSAAAPVAGTWEHHKIKLSYFGITSLFTCSGLEDHVRDILIYLGARGDAKSRASGCPGGWDQPSHDAWVDSDFYTLVPSDAAAPGSVAAQWTRRDITPRRPSFMGDGDCELINQMKDLILKNFTVRDVEYRTDCVPHQINLDGFEVTAQVLSAASPRH